jgi:hypothetical protein
MLGMVRSWKIRFSLLAVTALAVVAVGTYEYVPRCSELGQHISDLLSKAPFGDSVAQTPSCESKDLEKEVSFVSCGGFF